jgi:hypothetical protein
MNNHVKKEMKKIMKKYQLSIIKLIIKVFMDNMEYLCNLRVDYLVDHQRKLEDYLELDQILFKHQIFLVVYSLKYHNNHNYCNINKDRVYFLIYNSNLINNKGVYYNKISNNNLNSN